VTKTFLTLSELISFQASNFNNPHALNFKDEGVLRSFSNQEFQEKIFHFACGLREIGLQKGDSLANHSYQNPIWLIVDLGAILAGAVTVPIFENISQEHLEYEISDAQVKFIFNKKREIEILETKKIISFADLISLGANVKEKYDFTSSPQDLATIIYTSGSTGKPKGVELTHDNLISQIKATEQFFPLSRDDVILSFLPLAHIFERMVMMFYISQGVSIYFADEIKNVGNCLREFHPTLMTSVPRVLEKVFVKIKDGIESANPLKKFLGRKALQRALLKNTKEPKNLCDKIFDLLVYKKFRDALGGNMRMIICGGAALSPDMERFYSNIGINLFCGYGMTESSPVLSTNCPQGYKFGTVGKKFPEIELKISEDGELLARGPNIMRGYHNQPQKTAETIRDGWLATGDLAAIDSEGFIKIIGRKKEIFKNSNGKYISPVPIEQKLVQELGFLLGAIVIAEARQFTSALLFPEFENLQKFKGKFSFSGSDEEFLTSKILQKFVAQKIANINLKLDHWERVQKFHIVTDSISIKSGEVTPSMKLKRSLLEEKYKKEIEEFYN
jgi:long-chain acyl-CoA synthetase